MTEEDVKDIKTQVSRECWKKLKIICIQRDLLLPELVKDVLEKFVSAKKYENVLEE